MRTLRELFNRIRWDPEFGAAEFELGYYDRIEDRIIRIPFKSLNFPPETRLVFEVLDEDGRARSIPFHRVREIYHDGRCIWSRKGR